MSSEDSLVLMRPQSLEMGSYGEESEASRICLHSTHLVAIDNTDAGEWEHHTGLKQQGADSIAYCALCSRMQHGTNGSLSSLRLPSSHMDELPTVTAKVVIGNLFQSKLPHWIEATHVNSLTVLEITVLKIKMLAQLSSL